MQYLLQSKSIRCPSHPTEPVILICSDRRCMINPFVCNLCFQDSKSSHNMHQSNLKSVEEVIKQTTLEIQKRRATMDSLIQQCYKTKQLKQLMKYHNDMDSHLVQIRRHMTTQKLQFGNQIESLLQEIHNRINAVKNQFERQMDQFFNIYTSSHDTFRKILEPVKIYNQNYKHFSNPSTFYLKLVTESPNRLLNWFIGLKNNLNFCNSALADPEELRKNISNSLSHINHILQNLPRVIIMANQGIPNIVEQGIKRAIVAKQVVSLNKVLSATITHTKSRV